MVDDRIALDLMGGDAAPEALLEGALRACGRRSPGSPETVAADADAADVGTLDPGRVLLVGDEARARTLLEERGGNPGFEFLHASEVIGMHEKPGQALRAKPDSSIAVCTRAVKEGRAGAMVSMGNTGAVVGSATLGLGTLAGVRRPGIAVSLELSGHPVTLIDMGANVAPKPAHLLHYGVMGTAYSRDCLGVKEPRVALLNIGEESSKGNDLMREVHSVFESSNLRFVGNIEANHLFGGSADVIVMDGFTGNVVLKLMEGFAGFLLERMMTELTSHDVRWGPEALTKIKRQIDYSSYGGALLLGVSGVVVIGHGCSDDQAVSNALFLAARALDADVNADIVRALESPAQ